MHVFLPFDRFGTSERRRTQSTENSDGIQSWCEACRPGSEKGAAEEAQRNQAATYGRIPHGGVRCGETGEVTQLWLWPAVTMLQSEMVPMRRGVSCGAPLTVWKPS